MAHLNLPPQSEPVTAASAVKDEEKPDFSLVLGGPLFQLYLRSHLADPALHLAGRRLLGITAVCWLPLLLLSALQGRVTGGVPVPFLFDPEVHTRLLLALPLMIGSEALVHQRIRLVVAQFLDRGIIAPEDRPRFDGLIASAMRLRDSVLFEVCLLVFVFTLGHIVWIRGVSLPVFTWYWQKEGGHSSLTAAGYWFAFVSLPVFRFILYRWYFRLFIWYRFLWKVRKLPLHLNLYHPDRACGLSFLAGSIPAFAPVLIAQSIALAGLIAGRILYAGATLPRFKIEIAGAVLFMTLMMLAPLTFFALHLERAARLARAELGAIASRYVDDFRAKWVTAKTPPQDPLLGANDIQSLADIGNSYTVVNEIRLLPVDRQYIIRLVIAFAVPFLPLMLTMFPFEELMRRLFKVMF